MAGSSAAELDAAGSGAVALTGLIVAALAGVVTAIAVWAGGVRSARPRVSIQAIQVWRWSGSFAGMGVSSGSLWCALLSVVVTNGVRWRC